jgi:adenylate kinase
MSRATYWNQLLEAQDRAERQIEQGSREATDIIEAKRREAAAEVESLRVNYTTQLAAKKTDSDAQIDQLRRNLEEGQQERKADAATQVRSQKDAIVKLLLGAVLNVPLGYSSLFIPAVVPASIRSYTFSRTIREPGIARFRLN